MGIKIIFEETMEAYCLDCPWTGKEYDIPNDDDVCPCCDSRKIFLR